MFDFHVDRFGDGERFVADCQIFATHGSTATDVGFRDVKPDRFFLGVKSEQVQSLELFFFAAGL